MSDQNSIDFRVRVTDEGLAPLAGSLSNVEQKTDALGESAAAAGQKLDELGKASTDATTQTADLGDTATEAADAMDEVAQAAAAKAAAIRSALDVERSEIDLAKRTLELQRVQAQGVLQLAKAKGDDTAATQAANRLRQIESDQLALTARAKRAEADATQQATSARREALASVGPLTQAQQRELQVAENTAKALRTEAAAADEASRQVKGLTADLQQASASGPTLQTSLTAVSKAMAGLFALNKAKDFALDAIRVADAYGQMAERIQMATPIAEEYDMVQRRILESANLTYRRLEEQQELYIRTADALRGMAFSTQEVLDITDSFSYLLTTNAATVERGQNAIDAYTKSIQSGRIEVDSWQSIMSAMPTVVNAVAQATGKTADEVRKLGITGRLSINDLNEGLRQTVELNKEAAAGMSATVADAMTRLNNTWSQYIGEANRANQSTEKIVSAIDMLSANLDTVISLSIKAGEVMAVVWGIRALNALTAYTAQLRIAAAETTAVMAATATGAAKAGAAVAAAGKLAISGWVGWEIGSYLKDEFEVVEKAGIALAAGMQRAAAQVQAAWEMANAVFSDDTIAAAEERLAERIARIDDEYMVLFADVGKGSEQAASDVRKIGDAAEEASGRLRLTTSDIVTAWEAAKIAKLADAQATVTNLEAQIRLAQQAEQMALYMGNEYEARKAKILQLQLEIELVNAKVAVQRAEAEGSIAVAQAKLAEMAAAKEVDLVKQAELESAIKLAKAKLAEADAMGKSTELLQKQLEALRYGSGAADDYGTRLRGLSGAQAGFASATGAANQQLERQLALINARYASPLGADKYSRPTGGSVTGNTREERLAGQSASDETLRFELLQKLQTGSLTEADLPALKAVVSTLRSNQQMFDSLPPGMSSLDALRDDQKWKAATSGFEQAIARFSGGSGAAGAAGVGRPVTMNVNVGGKRYTAAMDSERSADQMVKALEQASLRS